MTTRRFLLLAALSISSLAISGAARAQEFDCQSTAKTIVNFPSGQLPFPDGANITDEFSGLLFSDFDDDLPPEYQRSLWSQENRIQDGSFSNLFRVEFLTRSPVYSVSVTLVDHNSNPQTHVLTAFSESGEVLDDAFFTDFAADGVSQPFPDEFTLTVSSCEGIAFIVAVEDPFGAERLERIRLSTARPSSSRP